MARGWGEVVAGRKVRGWGAGDTIVDVGAFPQRIGRWIDKGMSICVSNVKEARGLYAPGFFLVCDKSNSY